MARGSTLPNWVNGGPPGTPAGATNMLLVNAAIVSAYTPAVIVAAADSSDAWKAHANYQCDGTADDVQIQAAIDAVDGGAGTNIAAAGDCLVILAPGNYLTTAPINIYGRVRVQG